MTRDTLHHSATGNLGLPARPSPVAQSKAAPTFNVPTIVTRHDLSSQDSMQTDDESPSSPYKSSSMSSTGHSTLVPHMSRDDVGKEMSPPLTAPKPVRYPQIHRDLEKSTYSPHRLQQWSNASSEISAAAFYGFSKEDFREPRSLQETKAVNILLFLSFPVLCLSLINTLWTIISLIITLLTQPVRICARRPTFSQQLGGLLGPALNLQLKSIYTPLPPHADEDSSYHTGKLVMVQMISPILSLGMVLAAWVVAIYWLSSAVVGDPAGLDKKDDSRETVMALRRWWERWLIRGVWDD